MTEKTGTYFIIPSNTRILYFYGLKVSEIKKQLEEEKKVEEVSQHHREIFKELFKEFKLNNIIDWRKRIKK